MDLDSFVPILKLSQYLNMHNICQLHPGRGIKIGVHLKKFLGLYQKIFIVLEAECGH